MAVVPLHVGGEHNAQRGRGSATQKIVFSAAPFPEETVALCQKLQYRASLVALTVSISICMVACLVHRTRASRTGERVPAGGPGCVVILRSTLGGRQASVSHNPTLHSLAPWACPSP